MSLAAGYESCSCDDGDPAEFYHQNIRTARTPKHCYECGCAITKGMRYEHVFGKWYGDVSRMNTCALCLDLRDWAKISVPCFCWTHGEVLDNVRTLVEEARRDMPPGWMFEWGRRMVKIRRRQRARKMAEPVRFERTVPEGTTP